MSLIIYNMGIWQTCNTVLSKHYNYISKQNIIQLLYV